jgi:hypothetical protein
MDERDMEEEGKNRKRKGWRIEIKMSFLCLYSIVIRNPRAHRANKAYILQGEQQ